MLSSVVLPVAFASSVLAAGYVPTRGACPSNPLLRDASGGVNPDEAAYIAKRYSSASASLATWLAKVDPTFAVLEEGQYPMIALSDGGGGLRGFTISAGVHKAFDAEEPDSANYSTAGLYQAITYEAGLSGSALSLYSYVASNWALTSTLLQQLWIPSFAKGISKPPGASTAVIGAQVMAKGAALYSTALADVWGRILSYGTFYGSPPGLTQTISNFTTLPDFVAASRPYPITTAIGVENTVDACGLPPQNATQYEFTPHEFGSWENGVATFMQSKYIGTSMVNGQPSGKCTTGLDNAGYVAAISSNTFNQNCGGKQNAVDGFFGPNGANAISNTFDQFLGHTQNNNLAQFANPFARLTSAPKVSALNLITLIDGGETIQVPPIWPFLYRPEIDTLIVSDNSADSPANYQPDPTQKILINFPSGQQIYHTYQQAVNNNISYRMPYIPPPTQFMASNFNKRPMTFFGCTLNPTSQAMFIVYLPNRNVVYPSDIQATVTQYNESTTMSMIANGEAIATNNGDPDFAKCMACGLMKRASQKAGKALPDGCYTCFKTYCSNGYGL